MGEVGATEVGKTGATGSLRRPGIAGAWQPGGAHQAGGGRCRRRPGPTIYRLFGDKQGLVDAVAEHDLRTYLRQKRGLRHDVEASIKAYDAKLQQARRDLTHVNATLALFSSDEPGTIRAYTDTSRLFNRGELWGLCQAMLTDHGPQDTRGADGRRLRSIRNGRNEERLLLIEPILF